MVKDSLVPNVGRRQNPRPDYYPTVRVRIGDRTWNDARFWKDSYVVTGDVDTGSADFFIDEEIVTKAGIDLAGVGPIKLGHSGGETFDFYTMDLKVSLVGECTRSDPDVVPCNIVPNFKETKLVKTNPSRVALIGRRFLIAFGMSAEFSLQGEPDRLISAEWKRFQKEIADLFEAMGFQVETGLNLAGTQIEIRLLKENDIGEVERTVVKCKLTRRPVGARAVRELGSIIAFVRPLGHADRGLLVASEGFTEEAHAEAKTANIKLVEADELRSQVAGDPESKRRFERIRARPISPRKPHSDHKTAFVIMPFKDEYSLIYTEGIRKPLSKYGYACERGDELEIIGPQMEQILDYISAADLVVAEVTESNPNVYYELGHAHSHGKPGILLTRNISDAPFDVQHFNHILYRDVEDLHGQLDRRLRSITGQDHSDSPSSAG